MAKFYLVDDGELVPGYVPYEGQDSDGNFVVRYYRSSDGVISTTNEALINECEMRAGNPAHPIARERPKKKGD